MVVDWCALVWWLLTGVELRAKKAAAEGSDRKAELESSRRARQKKAATKRVVVDWCELVWWLLNGVELRAKKAAAERWPS